MHADLTPCPDHAALVATADLARRLVRSERASLLLPVREVHEAHEASETSGATELYLAAASGLPAEVLPTTRVRLGEPVAGLVAQSRQPLVGHAAATVLVPHPERYQTGAFISVPVLLPDRPPGVLSVADPHEGTTFHPDDVLALQSLAAYVAQLLMAWEAVRQQQWQRLQVQEAERQRLARELHDEAGQALTAAIFRLDLAALQLPAEALAAQAVLQQTRAGLLACAATLHRLAFALRPRILEDLGLGAALRSLVVQAEETGSLQVSLALEGAEPALDEAVQLAVFRVVQEGLSNVRKHAQASEAWIRVRFQPHGIWVSVEDNGVGLNSLQAWGQEQGQPRPSLGVVGLRERVELLGGQLELGERLGGGTRLAAVVPLPGYSADRGRPATGVPVPPSGS